MGCAASTISQVDLRDQQEWARSNDFSREMLLQEMQDATSPARRQSSEKVVATCVAPSTQLVLPITCRDNDPSNRGSGSGNGNNDEHSEPTTHNGDSSSKEGSLTHHTDDAVENDTNDGESESCSKVQSETDESDTAFYDGSHHDDEEEDDDEDDEDENDNCDETELRHDNENLNSSCGAGKAWADLATQTERLTLRRRSSSSSQKVSDAGAEEDTAGSESYAQSNGGNTTSLDSISGNDSEDAFYDGSAHSDEDEPRPPAHIAAAAATASAAVSASPVTKEIAWTSLATDYESPTRRSSKLLAYEREFNERQQRLRSGDAPSTPPNKDDDDVNDDGRDIVWTTLETDDASESIHLDDVDECDDYRDNSTGTSPLDLCNSTPATRAQQQQQHSAFGLQGSFSAYSQASLGDVQSALALPQCRPMAATMTNALRPEMASLRPLPKHANHSPLFQNPSAQLSSIRKTEKMKLQQEIARLRGHLMNKQLENSSSGESMSTSTISSGYYVQPAKLVFSPISPIKASLAARPHSTQQHQQLHSPMDRIDGYWSNDQQLPSMPLPVGTLYDTENQSYCGGASSSNRSHTDDSKMSLFYSVNSLSIEGLDALSNDAFSNDESTVLYGADLAGSKDDLDLLPVEGQRRRCSRKVVVEEMQRSMSDLAISSLIEI